MTIAIVTDSAAALPDDLVARWGITVVPMWLTIDGQRAICGLRLSDATMRHRTYKMEHLPASLRPTIAAAMVPTDASRSPST